MYSAVDNPGTSIAYGLADGVPSERIARMNSDTHDVARFDFVEVDVFESLIPQQG